jgi:glycosyltransferase involved in cell wall biosynthesis
MTVAAAIPRVSVVVPTKNSRGRIVACLRSLFAQSFGDFEVIVVDGHSVDDTVSLASGFPVRILFEEGGTRACACNVGVAAARGEIVAFTDDDCVVPVDWLQRIVENFNDSAVQIVGGPPLTPPDSTLIEKAFGALYTHILPVTTIDYGGEKKVTGCNSAYRRNTVLAVGGFNEALVAAEETELHHRIYNKGGKIAFDPKLAVYHYRRTNFKSFYRQFYRNGSGKGSMLRQHPGAFKISDAVAYSPFVYIPLLLIIALFTPVIALNLFMITIVLLTAAFLGASVYANIKAKQNDLLFHLIFVGLIFFFVSESIGHLNGLVNKKKAPVQAIKR